MTEDTNLKENCIFLYNAYLSVVFQRAFQRVKKNKFRRKDN